MRFYWFCHLWSPNLVNYSSASAWFELTAIVNDHQRMSKNKTKLLKSRQDFNFPSSMPASVLACFYTTTWNLEHLIIVVFLKDAASLPVSASAFFFLKKNLFMIQKTGSAAASYFNTLCDWPDDDDEASAIRSVMEQIDAESTKKIIKSSAGFLLQTAEAHAVFSLLWTLWLSKTAERLPRAPLTRQTLWLSRPINYRCDFKTSCFSLLN